jgi:hypothetical protein
MGLLWSATGGRCGAPRAEGFPDAVKCTAVALYRSIVSPKPYTLSSAGTLGVYVTSLGDP